MPATTCTSTTVRNISGKTLYFGYLPKHGRQLIDGEEYTFYGDLSAYLAGNRRKQDAYLRDLDHGYLALVSTPAPHYYDADLDVTKTLAVANNAIATADPCWGAYSSSLE